MKNRLYDYRHRRRRKVWPVVGFAVLLIVLEAVVVLFLSPAAGKKPGVALLPSPTPTAQRAFHCRPNHRPHPPQLSRRCAR
jgi:hypothetical protein